MKRLRITSLMDEYTDTEFFPMEGSAFSPERVKARVLAQAMATAPTRRKQKMPGKKKLLLAAALAAAMVLLMAAGYPLIRRQLVNWLLAGAEQLGITFVPTKEFEAMVEAETQ